jgi:putative peptidoglycan lipid II flippase
MSQQALPVFGATPAPADERAGGFVRHAKLISALTLLSRILGMAREGVVSNYFGAGIVSSAFAVAFKIPNLFRKLLGEGALSAAFIPLYAQAIKSGDPEEANKFAAAAVNLLALVLVGLTVVGEAGLWATAHFVELRAENLLIVRFTAIMLPYVVLICGTAFLSGILQVHRRFAMPALAPVLLNVVHIAVMIIGARILLLSHAAGAQQVALQTRLAYWLAGFVLVAGVGQIAMLLPGLRDVGFRFVWVGSLWTPLIRKMFRLSVPVALGLGVLQISVILDTGITVWLTRGADPAEKLHLWGRVIAYPLALGAVARLNWAQILYQFPLGVFATALATAIFPGLSADAHDRDREKFNRILRHGILFALFEGLPASVGLILVRYPAVRLLLERGSFTADDTRWVAMSVAFCLAAIWACSLQQILNRAYYALHDTTTPLVMAIVTIVVNTAVEIPLCFTGLGESAMAVGTLASFAIQAVVMLILLDRKAGGLRLASIATAAAKMAAATALMAFACLAVQKTAFYPQTDGHHAVSHLTSLVQLVILMVVGGATYAAAAWALGLKRIMSDA